MNGWKWNYREGKESKKKLCQREYFFLFSECRCKWRRLKLASVVPLGHCDTSGRMRLPWSCHSILCTQRSWQSTHCPHSPFLNSGWFFIPSGFTEHVQPSPPTPCGSQIIHITLLFWLDSPKPLSTVIVHQNLKGDFPWQLELITLDFVFCHLFLPVELGYWSISLRKWNRQEFRVTPQLGNLWTGFRQLWASTWSDNLILIATTVSMNTSENWFTPRMVFCMETKHCIYLVPLYRAFSIYFLEVFIIMI